MDSVFTFLMYVAYLVYYFISEHWLAIMAASINFLWLYLEYKASVWLWPVGIILPLFYIAVSWQALYIGNVVVNIYFLITSIMGWVMWLRNKKSNDDESLNHNISHANKKDISIHLGILAVLYYPVYLMLQSGNSVFPICDTIATLFSFLGMVYLSRKQVEHWLCWIIANSLSATIFFISEDYVSAFTFIINLIVSILGYRRWLSEIKSV